MRYFTEASTDAPADTEVTTEVHADPEDDDSANTDQGEPPASPDAAMTSTSPWPEFIHVPEDTDSE